VVAVSLQPDVSDSNLVRDTELPAICRNFSSVPPGKFRDNISVRQKPLPFTV
jgi:hypothetical protein